MNNTITEATTGQSLDSSVVNLQRAIAKTESEGNYNAHGASGEFGAYQFMPDTWKASAQRILGDPNAPMTPANQDQVAYGTLKSYKDQGYSPEEIASLWNSGKPNWIGNVGTNSMGVKYDVPSYVNSVVGKFTQFQQGIQNGPTQPNPSSVPTPKTEDQQSADQYGALFPSEATDTGVIAGLKAAGNLPSSAFNLAKGIASAVFHPIDTVEGLGNVLAGAVKGGLNAVGMTNFDDHSTDTFNNLAKSLVTRYGSLDNLRRTATNDPFGFGTDILTALDGGAAGLDALAGGADAAKAVEGAQLAARAGELGDTAKTAATAAELPTAGVFKQGLEDTLNTGAKIVTSPITTPLAGAVDMGLGAYGKVLGTEGGAIKEAIGATVDGGPAYQAFKEGLSGNVSQDELVTQARQALDEVAQSRSNVYSQMLDTLKKDTSTVDLAPVQEEVAKQLKKFNITKGAEGELDFSHSTLGLTSEQNKVTKMVSDVENWKDTSPRGIDILKQRIANYWEPGTKTGAFSEGLRSTTRALLEKTPGYSKAMAQYAEISEKINDITKALSLGDKAAVETTFKKLTGLFRQNNEFRFQLVKELDEATGGQLLPKIAGHQLSSWTPRGIAAQLEAGGLGFAGITGGTGIVPILATIMATSPKLVGTFIRSLRFPAAVTRAIMGVLDKFGTTAIEAGNAENKLNSSEN